MALTIEQANAEIQALIDQQTATGKKVITESSLKDIVSRLDLYAGNGKTTVLYSSAGDLKAGLVNDPNIRILDKTQASKFLAQASDGINQVFLDALEMLYDEEPKVGTVGNKANDFLYGVRSDPRTQGLWDTISKKFVSETSGDISTSLHVTKTAA